MAHNLTRVLMIAAAVMALTMAGSAAAAPGAPAAYDAPAVSVSTPDCPYGYTPGTGPGPGSAAGPRNGTGPRAAAGDCPGFYDQTTRPAERSWQLQGYHHPHTMHGHGHRQGRGYGYQG